MESLDWREEISSSSDEMVSDLELSCARRSELLVEAEGRDTEADDLRLAAESWVFWRWRDVISAFCRYC